MTIELKPIDQTLHDENDTKLADLLEHAAELSDWEEGFVNGLIDDHQDYSIISDAQQEKLDQIHRVHIEEA